MIRKLSRTSEEWPLALKPENCGGVEPPHELYLLGKDLPSREQCLGIVGTRRSTGAGREIAAEFARRFVEAGFAVVSGLAIGIDAIAHAAALNGGGHTIAVLGCGVDQIYPKENAALHSKVETHGTLVSEYPPGTDSRPFHFPARNRIIAALCSGVVVVEGGERSGALITARFALDAESPRLGRARKHSQPHGRWAQSIDPGIQCHLGHVRGSCLRRNCPVTRVVGPPDRGCSTGDEWGTGNTVRDR